MSEFELKLRVPAEQVEPLRLAFIAHGARPLQLQARYFDTEDGLLARHGIALRLRLEDDRWVQTLKTAGDGVVHRQEHEVAVAGPAGTVPALDTARHAHSEAGRLLQALLARHPRARLLERQATDILRLHVMLRTACGTSIEAAFDTGEVRAAGRSSALVEVELEHKGGPLRGVFDLAGEWVRHGGLWLSTLTKAERGERLLLDAAAAPRRGGHRHGMEIDGDLDTAALLHRMLLDALRPLLARAGDLAEGEADDETVHDVRIGLRRLRTLLRELAPLAPGADPGWDDVLGAAAAKLGAWRDQRAVQAAVRPLLESAGAPLTTLPVQGSGADAVAAVRDRGLQATLVAVLALAHADDGGLATGPGAHARRAIVRALDRLHRAAGKAAPLYEAWPLARQHRARKRLKRLRYLLEATAPLWHGARTEKLLRRVRSAQQSLGRHHDLALAAAAFRDRAAEDPRAWFAAGYLQAAMKDAARDAARALDALRRQPPGWR